MRKRGSVSGMLPVGTDAMLLEVKKKKSRKKENKDFFSFS